MAAVPHRWSLNSAVLIQRCLDLAIDKMSKANQRHLSVEWNISIPCTVLRQIIPHIDNIVAGRQFRCSAINRIFFKHKGIQKHLKQSLITKESRFTLKSRMKLRKIDFSAELPCQSQSFSWVLRTESTFREKHSSRSVASFPRAKSAWHRYSSWFSLRLLVLKL